MGRQSARLRSFARRFDPAHRNAPVILMYHRVATLPYDPWGMAIAADRFGDHFVALKMTRNFLSMDELVGGLESGDLPPAATAVTFDDGYADNAGTAKPILEELGVPATMFLTSGLIGSARGFWWDELAALVLGGREAAAFDFTVAGIRLHTAWPRQDQLPPDLAGWRCTNETADPQRSAYLTLWRALQGLDAGERAAAMARLRELLGEGAGPDTALDGPMSPSAAEALSSDLVSIGGHGRTHVPLTALPPAAREHEISHGRSEVAALNGGRLPDGFAYPHGAWDAETRRMVEQAGYRWAVCSRRAKIDAKACDRFALPRVEAANGTGAELIRSLASIGF